MTGRDPAEHALRSLQDEHWQQREHEAALLGQFTAPRLAVVRSARRWPLVAAGALLGIAATAATVTAADGWRWLAGLFSVRVVHVERDGGGIQKLILEDEEGRRLFLQPVDKQPELIVAVEREGGGTLRLRVVHEGDLGLAPMFVALDRHAAPVPGQRLDLRRVSPDHFIAVLRGSELLLTSTPAGGGEPHTSVLHSVPGQPHRYTDGNAVIEVVE